MSSSNLTSKKPWGVGLRKAFLMLSGTMGMLLLCLPLFSQGSFGRIMGTITDQSGGVVAGATVTITDMDRGVSKTFTTNEPGEYSAPTLNPGKYKVRVEAKGFKAVERTDIVLEVGREIRVDLALVPGAVAETMTITESVPLVETTNATLGGTINNTDIVDMPLNGRNYQNLVSLRPGVAVQPGGGPWVQSSNAIRPDENVWMIDGVINTNFYDTRPILNMPSFISDGATILPVDAIQEFNLMENPKAEYGWKPGAVVNVGIKSGTNTIHGDAYGFYRSGKWDARNLFNPSIESAPVTCAPGNTPVTCAKTPAQLKQFGGVMGGPIKKDKLFYFVGYEGLRSLVAAPLVTAGTPETVSQPGVTPKAADCPGLSGMGLKGDCLNSFVDAIREVQAEGLTPSPVSLSLAGCTLGASIVCKGAGVNPAINQGLWPDNPTNNTNFIAPFPNTNVTDNGIAKINYQINNKQSINGMLFIGNYSGDGMDHPFLNKIFENQNPSRVNTVSGDWVFAATSRLVNDARFGYDYVRFGFLTDDANILPDGSALTGGKGYAVNTGVTAYGGLPNINPGTGDILGSWHNRPQHWDNHYYDFQDNVSYLMGQHTLKFGGEFAHIDVTNAIPDTIRGSLVFGSLVNYMSGNVASGGSLLSGDPNRHETWNSSAVFFQDDWRVSSKLILNLGVRYSYISPIKEVNGLWGNFIPVGPNAGLIDQGKNNTLYQPDRKDFSPRVGFAWDLSGKGTTVLRGGFSIVYSSFSAVEFLNQNGFNNSKAVSIAAIPTGVKIVTTSGSGTASPVTTTVQGTGANTLLSASLGAGQLCWDPTITQFCPASLNTANGGHVFLAAGGSCGDGLQSSPLGVTPKTFDPGPCDLLAVDPNLTTPYITNWSLQLQHAVGSNLSFEVGYIGNHGSRLTGFRDLNQINPASPKDPAFPNGVRPFSSSFPYLRFINQISNDGRSNYHSLQASVTKRMSHGLSFIAGYTYGHSLDTGSLNRTAYLPQNSANPGAEYASGDFDIRHRLTITATYAIPGIKGYGQLLEGWKVNTIVSAQSAQPWLIADFGDKNFLLSTSGSSGTANRRNDRTERWNISGNPADFRSGADSFIFCTGGGAGGCNYTSGVSGQTYNYNASDSNVMWAKCTSVDDPNHTNSTLGADGCFVSKNLNSVITPPDTGTFGNIGRNIFRDSGYKNVDFSVFKTFTYKERYSAEFRLEFFNIFNHPIAANPYGGANGFGVGNDPSATGSGGGFGCGCATADVAAGSPGIGSGGQRYVQIGLKLAF
jgi:hypothetical protein